jgi:hypothetical protein
MWIAITMGLAAIRLLMTGIQTLQKFGVLPVSVMALEGAG